MKTSTKTDFSDQYIYIGIDVHLKQWQVSIFTDYGEFKTFSQPGEAAVLISYLRRTFAGAHLCCAYEAGFSGFWLQQELERHGIEAIVVHPPDVPTSDKERRFKRNKSDARKLARELRSGKLKAIYVPTVAQLSDRALVRNRDRLMRKQTRVKNQIKGHLYFFGIALPESRRYWSRAFLRWLEQCAAEPSPLLPPMAAMTLRSYLDELFFLRGMLLENTRAIRALARSERYRASVEALQQLKGIGLVSAMVLLSELIAIERFRGLDQLASFVGLVPGLGGSGENQYEGRLTKRRSARLRHILIESAWIAIRKDPELIACFGRLCKRMPANQAIIRIARKQLSRIRYLLRQTAKEQAEGEGLGSRGGSNGVSPERLPVLETATSSHACTLPSMYAPKHVRSHDEPNE